MVTNLGLEDQELPLILKGGYLTKPAEVWRFDLEHQAELLGSQVIGSGDELTLPAQSVTLYVFPELRAACTECALRHAP